jgi:thioredoxin
MSSAASGTVSDLTSKTLNKLGDTKVSIVDFWASWCVPCKKLAPTYEQACVDVAAKHPGEVAFYKINVEQEPSLAEAYGVMSIPAVIGFGGGKPLDRFSGRTKEDLIKWVEKLLGSK